MGTFYAEELCETRTKSNMCARSAYDVARLCSRNSLFLDCRTTDDKETVSFYYDIHAKEQFVKLRGTRKINRLTALLEIAGMYPVFREYCFTLDPDNLYYDRNYRAYVKERDLYERGSLGDEEEFLIQYKALIGCIMQKKYSFADYYNGGTDLYDKNAFLKKMNEKESIEEIAEFLQEEYEQLDEMIRSKKVEVNKSWYQISSGCITTTIILLAAACVFIVYLMLTLLPRKNAMLSAAGSYLSGNYVKVIDDLQSVDMQYLNQYQKYMLAVSYVRSESLTPEQKENILSEITIEGEEKLKDYWICLGRLDIIEAENVAMQRSDDELLLYAYMTEKAILEKNTEIDGEEKLQRLAELETKIEELAKQYEEEDENT